MGRAKKKKKKKKQKGTSMELDLIQELVEGIGEQFRFPKQVRRILAEVSDLLDDARIELAIRRESWP